MEDFENKENNKNQDILETETLDQVSEVENNIENNVDSTNEKNISLENNEPNTDNQEEMKLDDARRVKAVSPGLLVAKRFFRNKLALVGLAILIVLFLFCFLGSVIYKYSEKDVFTTNKDIIFDYSFAKINGTYSYFESFEPQPNSSFITNLNSNIEYMKKNNLDEYNVVGDNYVFTRVNDNIYRIRFEGNKTVINFVEKEVAGTYKANKNDITITLNTVNVELANLIRTDWTDSDKNVSSVSVSYHGDIYTLKNGNIICTHNTLKENESMRFNTITEEIVQQALNHISNADTAFIIGEQEYAISSYDANNEKGYNVTTNLSYETGIASIYSFDKYNVESNVDSKDYYTFLVNLINYDGVNNVDFSIEKEVSGSNFTFDYKITKDEDNNLTAIQQKNQQNEFVNYVTPSIYSIRRYSGEDSMSLESKLAFQAVMQTMIADNLKEYEAKIMMEAIDENGEIIVDENGNTQLEEETFYINTQDKGSGQQFVFRNYQSKLVGDLYAKPSKEHILGLDGNAMDVLARIMYGGRVSLLIGFIVVIIEIVLGAIMGGISGYFGGIVDNIIMRIVDIFYCIPTMPILIILGAVFDQQRLPNLDRLIWMMAVLGFLGWPSIARIVRGQILSLREQDFMIAAESSGLKSSRKIFKHLIPNVMPQLIVQATMGLGSVILTESTLSFLGLGVKFPMATWGQIINSVSSISSMVNYTYIWIPVGLLICLAVIAFNFVGDGLRDAFDPRASR